MPRIFPTHISRALQLVGAMTLAEKEQLIDEIYAAQPNLLASVVVQSKLGTSNEELDLLLNLLFVCYESVRAADIRLPAISEEIQEECLARVVGRAKFIENLSDEMRSKTIQDQLGEHGEPNLLALVVCELRAHSVPAARTEAAKYFLMSALNLVESIAHVAKDA